MDLQARRRPAHIISRLQSRPQPRFLPQPKWPNTHNLSSSRLLGYAIHGAPLQPTSKILLSFHGTPGTRFFFHASHAAAAAAAGVAVFTPERPGFGLSSPAAHRTLLLHAADVAELLDTLGVREVGVLGWSAGGPYALAFVRAFPGRVCSAALVSSLSPMVLAPGRDVREGMSSMSLVGYFAARWAPRRLLEWICWANGLDEVSGVLKGTKAAFSVEENRIFRADLGAREMFGKSALELYSRPGGARAEARGYALFCADWGFELRELDERVPLFLFAGEEDDKVCTSLPPGLLRLLPRSSVAVLELALEGGRLTVAFVFLLLYFITFFIAYSAHQTCGSA